MNLNILTHNWCENGMENLAKHWIWTENVNSPNNPLLRIQTRNIIKSIVVIWEQSTEEVLLNQYSYQFM